MTLHVAFGLSIRSSLRLPELAPGRARPDVIVRAREGPDRARSSSFSAVHISWRGVGTFHVRGGREIVVDPAPGADPRVVRLFLLGPALAVLLRQRGLLVLHASGVSLKDGAALFSGASGSGKSSLAAVFHQRGHQVAADDVVALEVKQDTSLVLPAIPQLKLWPDTATALGDDIRDRKSVV